MELDADDDDIPIQQFVKKGSQKTNDSAVIGWNLYFPGEPYSPDDPKLPLVEAFVKVLMLNKHDEVFADLDVDGPTPLPINIQNLKCILTEKLINVIDDEPDLALKCLGMAIYQVTYEGKKAKGLPVHSIGKLTPRLFGVEPIIPLRNLKSNVIGKLIGIKGTVVRVGNIKPLCVSMNFKCNKCDSFTRVYFKDGKCKTPTKCSTPNCRAKSFTPDLGSAHTVDWQRIRVQEQTDNTDPGRVPRTVECELADDLVDACVPGDVITLCGIAKAQNIEPKVYFKKSQEKKAMYVIYIDANSVDNAKQMDNSKMDNFFSTKELYAIREIADEPNVFKLIVHSLCPEIYGHEIVKAGLALCLFGGIQKFTDQKNKLPVRGDPHMLIVGDPGLGKSQMLTAIAKVAPRGVYVCGSYSSTTGLTVSLLRESGSGDYALEAGALILGDQGCCCIDEFDKMGNEHQALLEAMEQQSISIAKAGIVCSLPSRTSVIAAANPVGGHYNRAKTVGENLKMGAALLSRFDLIFILLDKPDEEKDQLLSEHVMAMHGIDTPNKFSQVSQNSLSRLAFSQASDDNSVIKQLRLKPTEKIDPIHPILLRKYISYARQYVRPKLTPNAATVIQDFYLKLREQHRGVDSTPITTRQLESLIRLAEARAKLELREDVTEQDAQDVIEIMKESLFQRFEDEYGNIDFRRSSGMSKTKEVGRFIAELQRVAEDNYNSIFSFQDLYNISKKIQLKVDNFADFVENLNTQNYLLNRGRKEYKLMTSSYSFGQKSQF